MSRTEEERGEWLLPSAEVAKVKKALRDAHNGVAEDAYKAAKRFWKDHRTQNAATYKAAADRFVDQLSPRPPSLYAAPGTQFGHKRAVAEAVRQVLGRIGWQARGGGAALHGATWADMESVGWGRKTNRDTAFGDADASVGINEDTRTLRWRVDANNHAVERAREGLIGRTLFNHLSKVKWTRGTGGVVWHVSEYDVDEFGLSNGARLTNWHGPRGAAAYKAETGSYPPDSPQAKAAARKARDAKARKVAAAHKRHAAQRQKQAALKQTSATMYCGAVKKDHSGLCGRKLAGGTCPDHGTVATKVAVGLPADAGAPSTVTTDPMR